MPDENGTETTGAHPAAAGEKNRDEEASPETQVVDDSEKTAQAEAQTNAAEDLKVVVSIKATRATVGVQRPSADPYIESFETSDLTGLAQEVAAVLKERRSDGMSRPSIPPTNAPLHGPAAATGASRLRSGKKNKSRGCSRRRVGSSPLTADTGQGVNHLAPCHCLPIYVAFFAFKG